MVTLTFQVRNAPAVQHEFPADCEIHVGRGDIAGPLAVTSTGQTHAVRVPLPTVSEDHAVITLVAGVATVTDRGSRNGTLVRLAPGEAHVLRGPPVSLGSDLSVRVEGARRALPGAIGTLTPEALCELLQTALAPESLRLSLGEPTEGSLPLEGAARHLVVSPAPGRTLGIDDAEWVRTVVNAYNTAIDQRRLDGRWRFVARSAARRAALEEARRVAPASVPVLLVGPAGSGRGVLAQDIHENSRRGGGPFVTFDCTMARPEVSEWRVFGRGRNGGGTHSADCPGDLEAADGGTLFIREVDALSLPSQVRLARYLESSTGDFQRMGDPDHRTARVRLIASTRRDLAAEVAAGRFLASLHHRLSGVGITLPAPAGEDIEAIARTRPSAAPLQGQPAVPSDGHRTVFTDPLGALPVQPAVVGRLLADILFLSVAAGGHSRSELAARVHMTYQGADARLMALGVTPGDSATITRRLDQSIAEFRTCLQSNPALSVLLDALPPR